VLAAERRYRVLERIAEQQAIRVGDLAGELGVSEMTVRRDIARLERDGFLRRTYGGAVAHITRSMELAFNARALQQASAKRMIAIEAARLVGTASTIFIGIGTTTEQFALFLPRRDDLTVVTASLPVASLLGTRGGRIVSLGGTVREEELSCYGPSTVAAASRYHSELAVLGAAGISTRLGLSELYDEDSDLHRVVIEHSDTVMILADSSKLGVAARSLVAHLEKIDVLVTDAGADQATLDSLRSRIPRVVVASGAHGSGADSVS
jgi:DeoR/GlpR family transcriptional regulator of sugar metabolism